VVRPLWVLPGIALLGTAAITGVVLVASSGGEEEVVQQVVTATPSPEASETATSTASPVPRSGESRASLPGGYEFSYPFSDAVGGYKPFSAAGATGYWFDDVLGFSRSTDVALSSDGFVYQFIDPDQEHQDDGVFLQTVLSFKRAED
jgi:hypothetical protein